MTIWEIDFYSRPILDENQKKIWEVLVCESPTTTNQTVESLFRYESYCPSTTVNSAWLQNALQEAIARAPKPPQRIRFFRRQMNNMIVKACDDIGIPVQASRRTLALNQWLNERMQDVYPQHPSYQPSNSPSVQFQPKTSQPLPDALLGQKLAFLTLEASALAEMHEWDISFGEAFPLELVGVTGSDRLSGVIIYSPRAIPIAGWLSGLELAFLKYDDSTKRFLLETGIGDSWILATFKDPQTLNQAKNFETAKQKAKNVHFLAVQSNPESESFAGFWLLQEINNG